MSSYNNEFSGIARQQSFAWSMVRRISFQILGVKGLNRELTLQLSSKFKINLLSAKIVKLTKFTY